MMRYCDIWERAFKTAQPRGLGCPFVGRAFETCGWCVVYAGIQQGL